MRVKSIYILLFFILFSCTKESEKAYESSFFDISQFVDSLLIEENVYDKVLRKISLDEEVEEKELNDVDMTEIFGFLKQFNINRPRWYDKYQVTKNSTSIFYKAINDELDVKEMKISYEDNKISQVDILYTSKTMISSSEKKVFWEPTSRLSLENKSKSLWSKEQNINMTWDY